MSQEAGSKYRCTKKRSRKIKMDGINGKYKIKITMLEKHVTI